MDEHSAVVRKYLRAAAACWSGNSSDTTHIQPFTPERMTAGAENELQVAVKGAAKNVDLPDLIQNSSYYKDTRRRTARGDTSRTIIHDLERYLKDNPDNVWENSWVRFPRRLLNTGAAKVLKRDLQQDRSDPHSPYRSDIDHYIIQKNGEEYVRIPISYLLKISLADILHTLPSTFLEKTTAENFLNHFLSDNTSPEIFSFYPAPFGGEFRNGAGVAEETTRRFLLCQFLIAYANEKFELRNSGQEAVVYNAPHPPIRQKQLNESISDSFYRKLFMSPCLSGWDKGEEKKEYMGLCHKVLSRSQLNTIPKLKESGIITTNLVVLPNTSNICLSNNGTHISIGSTFLTNMLKNKSSGFAAKDEKYLGDLAIKITEHFLPLFTGTFSAAPYRLDFEDFHPEKALGFLPHELDFTHLRMIWRRWKKKAKLKVFGKSVTPFGPEMLDKAFSKIFRLRGDYVHDFRLINYFVSVMSMHKAPALNGVEGNQLQLRRRLAEQGVFSENMSTYLLCKLRREHQMGFSGYEHRYFSLFESLLDDMSQAATLQGLITALAWKYMLEGKVRHHDIPDTPAIESERRQIFFGTAIGIPTFYVRNNTRNKFIKHILKNTKKSRTSRRYKGYLRVYNHEFRTALIRTIRHDAPELVEMFQAENILNELDRRVCEPHKYGAAARLSRSIIKRAGARTPMDLSGKEFNRAAEKYYREDLRKHTTREGFSLLWQDMRKESTARKVTQILPDRFNNSGGNFLHKMEQRAVTDSLSGTEARDMTVLLISAITECMYAAKNREEPGNDNTCSSSIHIPQGLTGEDRAALL
ncbi:MAG: hypothetical protein ACNI27_14710 [Desulfovibrio sp.]